MWKQKKKKHRRGQNKLTHSRAAATDVEGACNTAVVVLVVCTVWVIGGAPGTIQLGVEGRRVYRNNGIIIVVIRTERVFRVGVGGRPCHTPSSGRIAGANSDKKKKKKNYGDRRRSRYTNRAGCYRSKTDGKRPPTFPCCTARTAICRRSCIAAIRWGTVRINNNKKKNFNNKNNKREAESVCA